MRSLSLQERGLSAAVSDSRSAAVQSPEWWMGSGMISAWPLDGNPAAADHQVTPTPAAAATAGGDACGRSHPAASGAHGCQARRSNCSTQSPHPPAQQQQQHGSRPMHSRSRPAGSHSPLLDAARVWRLQAAGGVGPGVLAGRVRPGSAPCQQSPSPAKPSIAGRVWVPGGATATQQQLLQVYGAAGGWGSGRAGSAAAAGNMAARPHTSGGFGRPCSESPTYHRPSWQHPASSSSYFTSPDATRSIDEATADCASYATSWAPAMAQSFGRVYNNNLDLLGQQQQQGVGRLRPCSAPKARSFEPVLLHSTAARRPASSRVYSSSTHCTASSRLTWHLQQQRQQHIQYAFQDRAQGSEVQCWMDGECIGTFAADAATNQRQQQQQRSRQQPAWDASPIPLNTPKTVPIAEATQSAEALLAAKAGTAGVGSGAHLMQAQPHLTSSGTATAATERPRTAGASAAAAIMCEHPDSLGAGLGLHGGSSSGSSVYLVEMLQKLKQANSCCRKLGVARQYCQAQSSRARWNLEQIAVEVWQFVADMQVGAGQQQQQEQQYDGQQREQQGGWQLRSELTLCQFNRQLDKLIARAAAHVAAAADMACSGASAAQAGQAYAGQRAGASTSSSLFSSPAGSRAPSPNRTRPASAAAAAAAAAANTGSTGWSEQFMPCLNEQLQSSAAPGCAVSAGMTGRSGAVDLRDSTMAGQAAALQLPVAGVGRTDAWLRSGSRLSPRTRLAVQQQQQQGPVQPGQRCETVGSDVSGAAPAVLADEPAVSTAASVGGAVMLPYAVPAWVQEHL